MEIRSVIFTLTDGSEPIRTPKSTPVLAASSEGDERKVDVILFEVTNEIKTIDGTAYRIVNAYVTTNFDASKGYKITVLYYSPYAGDEVKSDPVEELVNYTINGEVPKYHGTGEDMPFVYSLRLYFPASLSTAMCYAYVVSSQGTEYRGVVYKRERDIRLNDYVATISSDFVKTNIDTDAPYSILINLNTPTDSEKTQERVGDAVKNLNEEIGGSVKKSGETSQEVEGDLVFKSPPPVLLMASASNTAGQKIVKIGGGEVNVTSFDDIKDADGKSVSGLVGEETDARHQAEQDIDDEKRGKADLAVYQTVTEQKWQWSATREDGSQFSELEELLNNYHGVGQPVDIPYYPEDNYWTSEFGGEGHVFETSVGQVFLNGNGGPRGDGSGEFGATLNSTEILIVIARHISVSRRVPVEGKSILTSDALALTAQGQPSAKAADLFAKADGSQTELKNAALQASVDARIGVAVGDINDALDAINGEVA